MSEREITTPVELCDETGVVAPSAIGWSRRPLHRCRVARPWGRRKRWHYWCVTSPREVVSLTFADLDYAGVAVAQVIDRANGEIVRDGAIRVGGWRAELPETADGGAVSVVHRGVRLAMHDSGARVSLVANTKRLAIDLNVTRPAGHDTLGVAVAWPGSGGRRFAYSSKQTALSARGTIAIDGVSRPLAEEAFGCLDWGRGVWPLGTEWNWASASGVQDGRIVGLNLGARWTEGGGATENGLVVDGALRKIAADVRFTWDRADPRRPWQITGDGVELTLSPEIVDRLRVPLLGGTVVAFGSFTGRILDIAVRDLFGWAEEVHVHW
jgi:hypothetical protein